MNWFLTCFAVGDDYADEMHNMVASFRKVHPGKPVVTAVDPIPAGQEWGRITNYKAEWCYRMYDEWHRKLGSMLWVDADARFRAAIPPPGPRVKFAAKTYARLSSGTMWFGDGAEDLLREWYLRAERHAKDEDSLIEAVRECGVEPVELRDTFTSVCNLGHKWPGHLEHKSAIVHWNLSRKRMPEEYPGWPPSEKERWEAMAHE